MGCCFSSEEDKDLTHAASGEREPLLNSNHPDQVQPIQGSRSSSSFSQQNQKEDEQSEFSRILRQTAINVIDVTSTESQNMEHGEMQDRATQYSNRLNMVLSASGKSWTPRPNLPSSITSPQMVLSSPCISVDDVMLITSYSEKLASAAQEIKVQHRESLIVSFGVP